MKIKIEIKDAAVKKELNDLAKKTSDLPPLLKAIGEYMLRATERRFRSETDPKGKRWKEIKPATRKRKKHTKILTESTHLRGSIRHQLVGKKAVAIGTNKPYGAIHQFGGKTMPARPYLGIGEREREDIVKIVNRYINDR